MKYWIGVFVTLLFFQFAYGGNHELAGEITLESRYYFNDGLYGNTDRSHLSTVISPQYSYSWDQDRKVITLKPFYRLDDPDEERTHFDVREASFVGAFGDFELRAGISKVYWGVTESTHLVDIINQIDFVENTDGEDRLGQLMVNPSYVSENYGTLALFILPHFRPRTFTGAEGRFRGPVLIDTENETYESDDEENHIDFAARWSHYIGAFEFGLGYFKGTDRDPQYNVDFNTGLLVPFYVQTEQVLLDAQYIYEDWIFKVEGLYKDSNFVDEYTSTVYGFEYTFSNIWGGKDVGVLVEHIYDERLDESTAGFYNHIFFGTRFAFNDTEGTEILFGGFLGNQKGQIEGLRLEATRRITNNWKWELEANVIFDPPENTLLSQVRADDYLLAGLSYYF